MGGGGGGGGGGGEGGGGASERTRFEARHKETGERQTAGDTTSTFGGPATKYRRLSSDDVHHAVESSREMGAVRAAWLCDRENGRWRSGGTSCGSSGGSGAQKRGRASFRRAQRGDARTAERLTERRPTFERSQRAANCTAMVGARTDTVKGDTGSDKKMRRRRRRRRRKKRRRRSRTYSTCCTLPTSVT